MDTHLSPLSAPAAQAAALFIAPQPAAPRATGAADTRMLPRGQAVTLDADVTLLQVATGRVWLTREGDPDDHFIAAPQTFALAGSARVVIEADGPAVATVTIWRTLAAD